MSDLSVASPEPRARAGGQGDDRADLTRLALTAGLI